MTIKDLSARTGYSVGTISRVLNDQPNVSEKARKVIQEAARECGFQLNTNAKQLKQQRGTSVLVVVKGISNELFEMLLESIQARMAQTRYPLMVDYIDENENEVLRAVRLCAEKKPLGIVFLGGNRESFLADFDRITVPCVLVTNSASDLPFPNLSSVTSDDALAARMAIDRLVELGHRQIAVVGGDRRLSDITRLRYQGCMEAFRDHGIAFDQELDYETARYSFRDAYRATRALLDRGRTFTALFAMSDVMAIGAIRALTDAGHPVPGDVSVLGLDGLPMGDFTVPRLATVRQSVEKLAGQALDLLLCGIEEPQPPRHILIPVTPDWKESAGASGCGI